jgi:hypothetical protein
MLIILKQYANLDSKMPLCDENCERFICSELLELVGRRTYLYWPINGYHFKIFDINDWLQQHQKEAQILKNLWRTVLV